MPGLYLRGSIANITMANLTPEQKESVESYFSMVTNHPEMIRHKAMVMKELGVTIKSDYAEDTHSAEQEYNIAIWRGLVNILYHRDYTFECSACGTNTYITQRNKPKPIERMLTPCPNCRKAEIADPGCSDLKVGDIVDYDEIQTQFSTVPLNTPKYRSVIKYIPGNPKYENPEAILKCPVQLKKFFGEFVWNYFRQQIKENKRKEHNKHKIKLSGPADEMILEEILSLCDKFRLLLPKKTKIEPYRGYFNIKLNGLLTPPEFSIELACTIFNATMHGISVIIDEQSINIRQDCNAPIITISVTKPEHVMMVDSKVPNQEDGESGSFEISQVSYKSVGVLKMNYDDHVFTTDIAEAGTLTRRSLPDGDCRKIYDIYSGMGEIYNEFSGIYGDGNPHINHVAEFLGITPRAVKQHRETIKVQCLAHNFVPELI